MANYFGYAYITYCTPLIELRPVTGKSPHIVTLEWDYEDRSAYPSKPYTLFNITRFIGNLYECEAPDPSTDIRFKDVATISWSGSATTPKTYSDDLSIYYSDTSRVLGSMYGITDKTDKEILDEIYFTKRPIYYALSTSVKGGGFGAVPYAIEAHTNGWVEARSTKTQVIHNILYTEGARIWTVNSGAQLSRTAVDINRVYKEIAGHPGPTGNGGWVWASEQYSDRVFKFKLKNGQLNTVYTTPGQLQGGHGLAVDADTGECMCGTYDYSALSGDNSWPYYILQPESAHAGVVSNNYACYGLTVWSGRPGWFASCCKLSNKIMLVSRNGGSHLYTNTTLQPYGIACTPQGQVLWNEVSGTEYKRGVCSNSSGNIIHRTHTGVGIISGPHTGQGATDAMGCGVDSEDNLWVCYANGDMLKGYYALTNSTDFPIGGYCRYPSLRLNEWSYSSTNTREFEWFLTRDQAALDNSIIATIDGVSDTARGFYLDWTYSVKRRLVDGLGSDPNATLGLMVSGSFTPTLSSIFKNKIRSWDNIFCDPNKSTYSIYNLSGREVFPFFPRNGLNPNQKNHVFDNSPFLGNTYMYSDFTGAILIGSIDNVLSNYSLTHPQEQLPSVKLLVEGKYQSQYGLPEEDSRLSNEFSSIKHEYERLEYTPLPVAVTGYDNLTVSFSALTVPGTFDKEDFTWSFNTKNYPINKNENTSNNILIVQNSEIIPDYTYYDPTMIGLTGNRVAITSDPLLSSTIYASGYILSGQYVYPSGSFYPVVSVDYIVDVYNCNFTETKSIPVEVRILERWPSAINYVVAYDQPEKRYDWFNCNLSWDKSADIMNRDVGYINSPGGNLRTSGRIAWGTDPLTAKLYDMSISRTWPISSWHWTITNNDWWNPIKTLSNTITTNDSLIAPYDTLSLIRYLSSYELRYGTYYVSLSVAASSTSTPSDNTFTSIISVLEFEPFANFMSIAASTVPIWYSDNNTVSLSTIIGYSSAMPGFINTDNTIISGYAPNLTVWFIDSSEAHTFPISSYRWNFGDYYDEVNNIYTISAEPNTLTGQFSAGCWSTQQVNHTAYHTYTMPGFYCVSLTVQASNTETADICSKPENCEGVYIYVQEINPNACFTVSNTGFNGPYVSGLNLNEITDSGYTVYFNPSCIIPGSFPICRIDWDFGDNSVLNVSRQEHSDYYYPVTAYNNDIWDPRNYIISHTYQPKYYEPLTSITVTMSAYACNTNTVAIATASIGSISRETNPYISNEAKHLVDTKIFDIENKMYLGYEIENTGLLNIYISSVK